MKRWYFWLGLLFAAALPAVSLTAAPYTSSELDSGYITVMDNQGAVILRTGLTISPDDQYLSDNNRLYEITAVEGTLAVPQYRQLA